MLDPGFRVSDVIGWDCLKLVSSKLEVNKKFSKQGRRRVSGEKARSDKALYYQSGGPNRPMFAHWNTDDETEDQQTHIG